MPACIESMENRTLWSATPISSVANGMLTITGTTAADKITVTRVAQQIRVNNGTRLTIYSASAVREVHVDAGAGNDRVEIAKSVALPSTLIGARGDDTLAGSTKHDSLSGGAGNDLLFGGAGTAQDDFDTSSGHDTVVKNPTPNAGQPSEGTTTLIGDVDKLTEIIFKDGVAFI